MESTQRPKPRRYDAKVQTLFKLVRENRVEEVREILSSGKMHPDANDGDFMNSLIIASKLGFEKMVKVFIEAGANVNDSNQLGITPVLAACAGGHVAVLNALINAGAYMTPSDLGMTPIGMACAHGQFEVVKYLVHYKLCSLPPENDKNDACIVPSPLMMAAMNGHVDILFYFLAPRLTAIRELTGLPNEAQEALKTSISLLPTIMPPIDIDKPADTFFNLNLLAFMAVLRNKDMVSVLLDFGADPNYRLKSGRTVAEAARRYNCPLGLSNATSESNASSRVSTSSTDYIFDVSNGDKSFKGLRKFFSRLKKPLTSSKDGQKTRE